MNRESERKRLVEILKQNCHCINEDCEKCSSNGICFTHREADHLLDNGVIVPPCKVGEVFYHIRKATCENIDGLYTICKFYRHSELNLCALPKGECPHSYTVVKCEVTRDNLLIVAEKWGKTAFPTREEAQKALEGKEDEGK